MGTYDAVSSLPHAPEIKAGERKGQFNGKVKELTVPRLFVAADYKVFFVYELCDSPPCRSFASSIIRSYPHRLLLKTHPLTPCVAILSKEAKERDNQALYTTPIRYCFRYPTLPGLPDFYPRHHKSPLLSVVTAAAKSATLGFLQLASRTTRRQEARRKRGAVCTAGSCISRLQCPAHGPNCCILRRNPIQPACVFLRRRSAQRPARVSGPVLYLNGRA